MPPASVLANEPTLPKCPQLRRSEEIWPRRIAVVRASCVQARAAAGAQFLSFQAAKVQLWGNGEKPMLVHLSAVGAIGMVATSEFVSQVLSAFGTLW